VRKLTKIFLFSFMFIIFLGALTACNNASNDDNEDGTVSEGLFTPGTFEGVGSGYLGDVTVEVTFSSTDILDVVIMDHSDTAGFADNAFDSIIPSILQNQSTNIDAVSGATYTANGVLEAVSDAIRQAGGNPDALMPVAIDTAGPDNTVADVIVVGGGMGGLTTAISSASNGASVILIEKLPMLGGSTLFGGGISVADSSLQLGEDGMITPEEFYENWLALQANDPRGVEFFDSELIEPLIANSGVALNFLLDLGYQAEIMPNGRMIVPQTPEDWMGWGGPLLVEFLEETALSLGVEIHTETRGVTLIEENGRITGVIAEGPSGEVMYEANNAVVLATGGFSRNEELMERFIPELAPFVEFSTAAVGHMGDGIVMAEEVGAVVHDDQWLIGLGITNEFAGMVMSVPGILVNHEGNRFVMETRPPGFIDHYTYVYNYTINYSPEGSFFVFDSSEIFEGRIAQVEENLDHPSAFRGETIQELAEAMGVPYENLLASIDLINAVYAEDMEDPLGRTVDINPITEGPFYAMRLYPFDMGTIGGVHVNEYYQVIDANSEIIPGLFAVGEMSNGRYIGSMYFSGLSLMIALQQGITVGEVVAR